MNVSYIYDIKYKFTKGQNKWNMRSNALPCLAIFENEPSIKTLVCKYKSKYILDTFGEEIIALNPLIDVFQLEFEKFECYRLFVCYSNWLLKLHKSQICFNVKLNMHLYTHSFILSMFIISLIIKLQNYMVPEQN